MDAEQPSTAKKGKPTMKRRKKQRVQEEERTPETESREEKESSVQGQRQYTRTRKIRLYPTEEHRKVFNEWFGTTRWSYNQMVDGLRKNRFQPKAGRVFETTLRRLYQGQKVFKNTDLSWVLRTPQEIRDTAVQDFTRGMKAAFTNKREGNIDKFAMRFRSKRKLRQESLQIRKRMWNAKRSVITKLFRTNGILSMPARETLPEIMEHDSKLVRTNTGKYYLCLTDQLTVHDSQVDRMHGGIALDPGVRTFMTGYSPDGHTIEIGTNASQHVYGINDEISEIQALQDSHTISHRTRRNLVRRLRRLRERGKHQIDDLHKKTAKYLCENYQAVILPPFKSGAMRQRTKKRKIGKKIVRGMLTLSHCRFRERLVQKSEQYTGCRVILSAEPYTSKTCTRCGYLNNVGSAKTLDCKACFLRLDRDVNGARNILHHYLSVNNILP